MDKGLSAFMVTGYGAKGHRLQGKRSQVTGWKVTGYGEVFQND